MSAQHTGTIAAKQPAGTASTELAERKPNPTTLQPGSFVYLWAPGDVPRMDRPILGRVERTTVDTIVALDLASGARAAYGVGVVHPAGLRWSWELAAPPETPQLTYGGQQVVDRAEMSLEDRKELLFGAPGSTVRISARDGQSYVGVPTLMVIDGDEDKVCWVRVQGPTDSRGPVSYMIRFEDITAVIQGGGR